jgi:hypothetical protein
VDKGNILVDKKYKEMSWWIKEISWWIKSTRKCPGG